MTFLCESTVCTRAWFSDKGLLCQCTFEAGEARDYIHTTIWLLSSLLARSSPSSLVEKVVEATVYTTYI